MSIGLADAATLAHQACAAPLRAMGLADLPEVVAIEQRAYSHPWSQGNFIDALAAGQEGRVLRAADGTLAAYFVALAGVDELHLLNITVAPALQGHGLGARLLREVEALASALALAQVWLEVRAGNRRAIALYERFGFRRSGLRKAYYPAPAGREDAVLMTLQVRGIAGADGSDRRHGLV